MAKKKSSVVSEQNVSAAYDRLRSAANQVGSDTQVMWTRITELEAEVENITEDYTNQLAALNKEFEAYKVKSKAKIEEIESELDSHRSVLGSVAASLHKPLKSTGKPAYTVAD